MNSCLRKGPHFLSFPLLPRFRAQLGFGPCRCRRRGRGRGLFIAFELHHHPERPAHHHHGHQRERPGPPRSAGVRRQDRRVALIKRGWATTAYLRKPGLPLTASLTPHQHGGPHAFFTCCHMLSYPDRSDAMACSFPFDRHYLPATLATKAICIRNTQPPKVGPSAVTTPITRIYIFQRSLATSYTSLDQKTTVKT